jgi:hypothetical protein
LCPVKLLKKLQFRENIWTVKLYLCNTSYYWSLTSFPSIVSHLTWSNVTKHISRLETCRSALIFKFVDVSLSIAIFVKSHWYVSCRAMSGNQKLELQFLWTRWRKVGSKEGREFDQLSEYPLLKDTVPHSWLIFVCIELLMQFSRVTIVDISRARTPTKNRVC